MCTTKDPSCTCCCVVCESGPFRAHDPRGHSQSVHLTIFPGWCLSTVKPRVKGVGCRVKGEGCRVKGQVYEFSSLSGITGALVLIGKGYSVELSDGSSGTIFEKLNNVCFTKHNHMCFPLGQVPRYQSYMRVVDQAGSLVDGFRVDVFLLTVLLLT